MRLLVTDCKAKADTLRPLLGPSWEVVVVTLPLRTLPARSIGINASGELTYQLTEHGAKALDVMAQWLAPGPMWIATDPGEVGDAQAWHIRELLRRPDARRLHLEELTATGLRRALRQASEIQKPGALVAELEHAVDRMVGALCDLPMHAAYPDQVHCVGRKPHAILTLLLRREREARLSRQTEAHKQRLQFPGFVAELDSHLMDELSLSPESCIKATWFVRDVHTERHLDAAPLPFNLRSFVLAAAEIGVGALEARSVAMDLYRTGLLSFPLTDDESLDALSRSAFVEFARGQHWPIGESEAASSSSNAATSGVRALRVTSLKPPAAFSTPIHARLYALVLRRCLASVLQCAVYERHTLALEAIVNGPKGVAHVPAHAIYDRALIRGWRHAAAEPRDELAHVELRPGTTLTAQAWLAPRRIPGKSERFDLAGLADAARQECGLSFRGLLASLQYLEQRELIQWKDRRVLPTGRGIATAMAAEALRLPCGDLRFTRSLADQIDSVRRGQSSASAVLVQLHAALHRRLALSARKCPSFGPCPVCQKGFTDEKAVPAVTATADETLVVPSVPPGSARDVHAHTPVPCAT